MGESPAAGRRVGINQGRGPWADAAYDVLREVASRYNETISYADLAQEVQRRSGLWTEAQQRNWIGKVLSLVVHRCHGEGTPALTALVVHKTDGMVGDGYDEMLRVAGEPSVPDQIEREQHAAQARLRCYEAFCPDLPDNASPTLTAVYQATVARRRHRDRPSAPAPVCPTCYMQLPLSGICQNCT